MKDMDVIIVPRNQQLTVHPERPYLAKKSLKCIVLYRSIL